MFLLFTFKVVGKDLPRGNIRHASSLLDFDVVLLAVFACKYEEEMRKYEREMSFGCGYGEEGAARFTEIQKTVLWIFPSFLGVVGQAFPSLLIVGVKKNQNNLPYYCTSH